MTGDEQLRLRVRGPASEVSDALRAVAGVGEVSYQEPFHTIRIEAGKEPQGEITSALVAKGWSLLSMESVEMSLEQIFLQLTGANGEGSDEGGGS